MKKSVQDFYIEISILLKREHPELLADFNDRITVDNPKQIFLWLQLELEKRSISDELDEVMTDLFYSIH